MLRLRHDLPGPETGVSNIFKPLANTEATDSKGSLGVHPLEGGYRKLPPQPSFAPTNIFKGTVQARGEAWRGDNALPSLQVPNGFSKNGSGPGIDGPDGHPGGGADDDASGPPGANISSTRSTTSYHQQGRNATKNAKTRAYAAIAKKLLGTTRKEGKQEEAGAEQGDNRK